VSNVFFDQDRIEAIASSLELRDPNRDALESIVYEVGQHYEIDRLPPPFEAVTDSATGAGKTYILAAAIEYFAAEGIRNFAVIAPGRTILAKTVGNFSPGHPKSLTGGMQVEPVVITSDNFATPVMGAAMDDPEQVKLFVFTVQALIKPGTKAGRRTHKFQEGLGQAFYERLQESDDLFVFADEHHAYYGTAFSKAVRDLHPRVLIGLTATPHRRTPEEQIIYRYPLAAAIADKVVKTPVIVGRKDDRTDPRTKLLDGITLLDLKDRAIRRYAAETGKEPINPVMLVVAPSIEEADEVQAIVEDRSFARGRFADRVLTVHSDSPDEALAALEELEEPDSPYRIVVSVGMLKEGWDVKNVYVICSLRASVSTLLTEQTLGRGLRLPFGAYTDIEILDTLEVLGHERYEELLKRAGVLAKENFVDRRSRAVLRRDAEGRYVPTVETTEGELAVGIADGRESLGKGGRPLISSVEGYTRNAKEQLKALEIELRPRKNFSILRIPRLRMTPATVEFSLADITDLDPFVKLGKRIASDPENELRRMTLSARVVIGADGLRRTELVTAPGVDHVQATGTLVPLDESRDALTEHVLVASVVPPHPNERAAAAPIIDAFIEGLGGNADEILSGYLDRATGGLISLITEEQRRVVGRPTYHHVVELTDFKPVRMGRPQTSRDLAGTFKRGVAYIGFKKSLFDQDWFDSSTERTLAGILDEAKGVKYWVRLNVGDLPILWSGAGREYNPDFIAVEMRGMRWVIEVKMDKEMAQEDVQRKREAARRWANHVSSAAAGVGETWRYLLASEADVKTAKGSWSALKKLAS
jgi:type III restriction enzyme